MATIQQRRADDGTTSYRVRVRLRGHPLQTATFARKTDAKRWAQQIEAAMREGRHFKSTESKKHTVADAIDRYERDVLAHRGGDAKRRAAGLAWWRKAVGVHMLADLTPSVIAEHRDRLRRERTRRGTPRAPATVNRYLAALSHMLTVATNEWEWLDHNPMAKVTRLSEPKGRVTFLTRTQIGQLIEACKASSDPRLYPLVVLALGTGARQGELVSLRWANVDLDHRRVRLEDTKNGERRSLALSDTTHAVLTDLARVRSITSDLVFALPGKTRATFPRHAWEKTVAACGFDEFRFHDLRHTAASHMAMEGASLLQLAEFLGHKTLAMVKRYSHLTEGHTARVVEAMNGAIFEAVQ